MLNIFAKVFNEPFLNQHNLLAIDYTAKNSYYASVAVKRLDGKHQHYFANIIVKALNTFIVDFIKEKL